MHVPDCTYSSECKSDGFTVVAEEHQLISLTPATACLLGPQHCLSHPFTTVISLTLLHNKHRNCRELADTGKEILQPL